LSRPDAWAPTQYERFREERALPFYDLQRLVTVTAPRAVVDLGCGTGELTAVLHRHLGAAATTGVDSSEAMLQEARALRIAGLSFVNADIAEWTPLAPLDLVFSNAALHWVPDHTTLFVRLATMLAAGGELAVQMPANFDHPSHVVATEVAREQPFADALGGYVRVAPVLAPEAYAELLHQLGFVEQQVRLQVYGHTLESTGDVAEWVKGSLLTDYAVRLPDALYPLFVERYRARLLEVMGNQRPYFYAFKRILLWGRAAS
jgi:trans-aconitate 2-methyltransferase